MSADHSRLRMKIEAINVNRLEEQSKEIEREYANEFEGGEQSHFLARELSYYVVSEEGMDTPPDENKTRYLGERSYHINHDSFSNSDLVWWMEVVDFVGSMLYFDDNLNPLDDGYVRLRRKAGGDITIENIIPSVEF